MRNFASGIATTAITAALATTSFAADNVDPVPVPVDPSKVEFTGTWHYTTSNHKVSGRCPNGSPMDGTLEITHAASEVGVMVTSGAVCNPASMCMYSGAIADGHLLVSNTAIVDEEGGSATNAMRLFFSSASGGGGEVASGYVHPDGFECQWSHNIDLWRSES